MVDLSDGELILLTEGPAGILRTTGLNDIIGLVLWVSADWNLRDGSSGFGGHGI